MEDVSSVNYREALSAERMIPLLYSFRVQGGVEVAVVIGDCSN